MKNSKKLVAALGVSVVALSLAGCISVESAPQGTQDDPPATSTQAPTADVAQSPAPAEAIADAPSADATEPADADDTGQTEAPATEKSDENAVDLSAEEGTVYLYAHQAFSPTLQRWVVDGDTILFQELDCLGRIKQDVTASLVDTGSDTYVATWDGQNPLINSPESKLAITDSALTPDYGEIASSRAEAQADIYQDMCIEAGGAIADFLF